MSPPSAAAAAAPYHDDPEKSAADASTSPTRGGIRPLPRAPSHNQLQQVGAGAHEDPRVDINALAMEVASVLLHTPPRPGSRHQRVDSRRNDARYESASSNETNVSAPPHYRPS
jgi:hypothetical protein